MVLPRISIPIITPVLTGSIILIFADRLCDMEVLDLAEVLQKAKLALMPPDVLEGNMSNFAETLGKLKDFADTEQRSILELAQDVNLTSTWTRLREDISQRARDFHNMEDYIVARQDHKTYRWVRQWRRARQAQRRVVRDTGDIAELLAEAERHK